MQIKTKFSNKQNTDSGLALLLIILFLGLWLKQPVAFRLAIAEVLILLTFPVCIYPFTFLWLNISDLLGMGLSKIILTFIFFLFVFPVGIIRKLMGRDTLRLKEFRKGSKSVFTERNSTYSKADFKTPY